MKQFARGVALKLLPAPVISLHRHRLLRRRASELNERTAGIEDPGRLFDALQGFPEFRLLQRRSEIVGLLERIRALRPRTILEIGTANGGSAWLFARIAPKPVRIVTADFASEDFRRAGIQVLMPPGAEISFETGDSHAPDTRARIERHLKGNPVDFLFIDGDHSYEGVRADFQDYSPCVRPGGLIAFHDIVQDHQARFGRGTSAATGGVPTYWNEIRRSGWETAEIVENQEQDGYGIGLVQWNGVPAARG